MFFCFQSTMGLGQIFLSIIREPYVLTQFTTWFKAALIAFYSRKWVAGLTHHTRNTSDRDQVLELEVSGINGSEAVAEHDIAAKTPVASVG